MQIKIGRVSDCNSLSVNNGLFGYGYKYINIRQINKSTCCGGNSIYYSFCFGYDGKVEKKSRIVQADSESFVRVIPRYFSSVSGKNIFIERSKGLYSISMSHYDTARDESGMADTDIGINNNENGISGSSNDIPANDNRSSEIVSGTSAYVTGNSEKVDGNSETITGRSANVIGSSETVIGSYEIIDGSSEIVDGISVDVSGTSETVYGFLIDATGSSENVTSMPEIVIGTPVYVNGMSTVKIDFYKNTIILYVTNIEIPIEK